MTNQKIITGIGRAFTDIIATVDDAFLEKFQLKKGVGVRVTPEVLQAMIAELKDPVYMAGGSVANTMACLRALGHDVCFIGKTGDDEAGHFFRKEFERTGVMFPNPPVPGGISGTCLCLNTKDGERSFAFTTGVCEEFTPQDMPPTLFENTEMLFLQVLMLETYVCYESVRDSLPALPSHVRKVMSLHDLHDKGKITDLVLQHVDILLGNYREYDHILGIRNEADFQAFVAEKNIMDVMTCGAKGAVLAVPDEVQHIQAVPPKEMIDTVGAGDAFAAGLLYGISHEWPLKQSGDLGATYASLIIEQVGARPNEKTVRHISEFMD